MTSLVAHILCTDVEKVMAWSWPEIIARHGDAVDIVKLRARMGR